MKRNIVLIGMPGAGKTTAGKPLAELLHMDFLDTDDVIRDRYGMTLEQLIEQNGLDGFKQMENEVCRQLDVQNTVISTGGSVVYGREAMKHLLDIGTVVYLCLSEEETLSRLKDPHARGVVMREGETLSDLYRERAPLYEQYAEVTVNCDTLFFEPLAQQILQALPVV